MLRPSTSPTLRLPSPSHYTFLNFLFLPFFSSVPRRDPPRPKFEPCRPALPLRPIAWHPVSARAAGAVDRITCSRAPTTAQRAHFTFSLLTHPHPHRPTFSISCRLPVSVSTSHGNFGHARRRAVFSSPALPQRAPPAAATAAAPKQTVFTDPVRYAERAHLRSKDTNLRTQSAQNITFSHPVINSAAQIARLFSP